MPSIMHQKTYKIPLNIISQPLYTFKKLSHNLARCPACNFCIISAPILAFFIATLQLPGIFPQTIHISHIPFQHTFPSSYLTVSTTTRKFQHTFSIYVGNSNTKHIFPTHFSNILFTNEEGVPSHPFRLLNLLPTHSSHLLLYPLTDTPQEVFQHIHSVDGKLPHKIIRFIKLLLKRPVLNLQLLILSL